MYYDLGLGDWTFEIEQSTGQQITDRLMKVEANYPAAQKAVRAALKKVDARYDEAFPLIRNVLNV